jgi:hypothetical protein
MIAESWVEGPMLCEMRLDLEMAGSLGMLLSRLHHRTLSCHETTREQQPLRSFSDHSLELVERNLRSIRRRIGLMADVAGESGDGNNYCSRLEPDLDSIKTAFLDGLNAWQPGVFPLSHTGLSGEACIWVPGISIDSLLRTRKMNIRDPQVAELLDSAQGHVALADGSMLCHTHRGIDLERGRLWFIRSAEIHKGRFPASRLFAEFENNYWSAFPRAEQRAYGRDLQMIRPVVALPVWRSLLKSAEQKTSLKSRYLHEVGLVKKYLLHPAGV